MRNTTKNQVSRLSLREQLLQLTQRVSRHWRGTTTPLETLTHCIAIVVSPFAAGIFIGLIGTSIPAADLTGFKVAFYAGWGGTLLAAGWWCKGMFALSNRLLSSQRLLAGLLVFLTACSVTWALVSSWSGQFVQDIEQELTAYSWNSRPDKDWQQRPVEVIAIPELHRFFVKGSIGAGSAKALAAAIERNPEIRLVELESSGGYVREANALVDLIQKNDMDTLARGWCLSACTEIFVAGKRRFVGPEARFGFHQSGFDGRERNTDWSISEYESSILYRSKRVTQDFADKALNTSYYSLWMPDVLDVKREGFATHWWSERPKEYD